MIIISGSSPKQQPLGQRMAPCTACRQQTSHRFQRNYRVKHVFWFPLFSMGTTYAMICERCNLFSPVAAPAPGTMPAAPFLHRMGFLIPFGVVMLPLLLLALALVAGVAQGGASGGGKQAAAAETEISGVSFRSDPADQAALAEVEKSFDELGLRGLSVAAASATTNGKTVRLVTAKYSRLKKVSDGDRVRLLKQMEQIADDHFPDDEVFLGLQGRILWGGHSHRKAGQEWSRVVDQSTASPETDARAAVRTLELAAAAAKPAAAGGDAAP